MLLHMTLVDFMQLFKSLEPSSIIGQHGFHFNQPTVMVQDIVHLSKLNAFFLLTWFKIWGFGAKQHEEPWTKTLVSCLH